MKIIVAKAAGFCMGVKRAVELAIDHAQDRDEKLYTFGPLIHNQQTIDMLNDQGVEVIPENNLKQTNSKILIRAHGIPPQVQGQLEEHDNKIIDGTCPKVKAVHKVIQKYRDQGYVIVVTGDEGHAEVIGLMGYAGDVGCLIHRKEDLKKLPRSDKYCLVSQTTFDGKKFDEIATLIKNQYSKSEIVVKKTICSATKQRQVETRDLSQKVDAMIVVGGKHSANTLRLASIAKEYCSIVQLVETENEIDWNQIKGIENVGVTAGASTPHWMIKRVVDYLYSLNQANQRNLKRWFWKVLDLFAYLNFFVALGAGVMFYASCLLQGYGFTWSGSLLIVLYFLSIYLWNSLASMEVTRHLGISRYLFYQKHKKTILTFVVSCLSILLALSYSINKTVFILMMFSSLAGILYHLSIVPKPIRRIVKYRNLKDLPTSRDFFTALAWAVLVTFVPQAIAHEFQLIPTTYFLFVAIFFMAYFRTLVFDLRDIEGDRIFGRETLVSIIGERKTKNMILGALWLCLFFLMVFSALSLIPNNLFFKTGPFVFLFQIPVLVYIWFFMKYNYIIKTSQGALFSMLADSQFFIAALGVFFAM